MVIKRKAEELLRLINSYRRYSDPAQIYRGVDMKAQPRVRTYAYAHKTPEVNPLRSQSS